MPIARRWQSVFTAQVHALPVALCRLGIGMASLTRALKVARDVYLLRHDPTVVPAPPFAFSPSLDSTVAVVLIGAVGIIASLALLVGYRARFAAAVLTIHTTGLYLADQNFWGHWAYFLGLMTLLLSLVESDAMLSVRALNGRGSNIVTGWPVLLMKIQISLVYLFASLAKLNPVFLSGFVIASRSALPVVATMPRLVAVLGALAIGGEFFLAFALWFPRLRWPAVAIGLGIHGLSPVLFGFSAGLLVYSVAMVSGYALFIDMPSVSPSPARAPRGDVAPASELYAQTSLD